MRVSVDVENAGSGTRATDLTALQWQTFRAPLDGVREHLWRTITGLVGREGAAGALETIDDHERSV